MKEFVERFSRVFITNTFMSIKKNKVTIRKQYYIRLRSYIFGVDVCHNPSTGAPDGVDFSDGS